MRTLKSTVGQMLSILLPTNTAGACIPNSPYYTCRNGTLYYCYNNCSGQYFCSPKGRC